MHATPAPPRTMSAAALGPDPFDYPVYPCPRCGERAVSLHSSDPDVVLRCDRCEVRFYPDEKREVDIRREERAGGDPFQGVWEVWDNEERQGSPLRVDLDDSVAASALYPEEFSDQARRNRRFRENFVLLGCGVFGLLVLVLMVLAAYRCA